MTPDGFAGFESAGASASAPRAAPACPLVTVIVRSMDRPELGAALASIANQDYPAVETIVVDATGGRHRALAARQQSPGHSIRMVSSGERLKRPRAADLGLASASGEWFTFLDDDDTCEPSHLSSLVAAARLQPDALVVYGRGRLFNATGELDRVFGRPFNRALMHFGPLFYWQSALIRTRVRDLGCRFDPAFDVCEDRDLLAQIAEHGDFAFVPDLATFNYRPDLGTSGTGDGRNRDFARVARYENLLRAKWAGQGTWHNERVAVACRRGVRAFLAGDVDAAGQIFTCALDRYPDDPNAMHGMSRVALAHGDRVRAEAFVRAAIDINPMGAEYRSTLAEICGPDALVAGARMATVSRMGACPCGSGRRFKVCCGSLDAKPDIHVDAVDGLCADAQHALDHGDAAAAFEALERAATLRCDARVGSMLETCCAKLAEAQAQASLWAMAERVRVESARRASTATRVLFGSPEEVPPHGVTGPGPGSAMIMMPRDDPAALVRALARLADGWPDTRLDYDRIVSL